MSASVTAPALRDWLDKLSPDQTEHLRAMVDNDEVLPPIEDGPEQQDRALETWLQTVAVPACEAVKAGRMKLCSYDEALDFLAAEDGDFA